MSMAPKTLKRFDASCFNGVYVTDTITEAYLEEIESASRSGKKTVNAVQEKAAARDAAAAAVAAAKVAAALHGLAGSRSRAP
jgi:hypothetical protein